MSSEELIQQLTRQNDEQKHELNLKNTQIDELTNMVVELKELIQQLRDEIAVLKDLKSKPKIDPSRLEGSNHKLNWHKKFEKPFDKGKQISFSSLFTFWGTGSLDNELEFYRRNPYTITNILSQTLPLPTSINKFNKSQQVINHKEIALENTLSTVGEKVRV